MPLTPYNQDPRSFSISYKLLLGLGTLGVCAGCYTLIQGWLAEAAMIGGLGLALLGWGVLQHPTWNNTHLTRIALVVGGIGGLGAWIAAMLQLF